MTNPFDRFDSASSSAGANPFDQFDAPVAQARTNQSFFHIPQNAQEQQAAKEIDGSVLARTGRDVVGGLGGIADIGYSAVAPIYHGMRAGLKDFGVDVGNPQDASQYAPSNALKAVYDKVTDNAGLPQNKTQEIADKAGEFLAGGGVSKALQTAGEAGQLAPQATKFLEAISPQTTKQAIAFAGAGAGGEAAHVAFPNSEIAPIVGTLAGGMGAHGTMGSKAITGEILDRAVNGSTADRILAGRLAGQDLSAIKENLAKSSDPTMLPDITGDEVKGLTRAVGAMTGGAKQLVSDALEGRSEGAVRRISQQLSKNISNVDTYFTSLDDMANARASIAAPMYKEAFSKNQNVMSSEINRIINTPAGQSALKSAATKMQNDMTLLGVPDRELAEQAQLAGTYQPGGIASGFKLRTLDYMKRALDDQIGAAQRVGESDNARILTGLKNQFVSALDKVDVTAKAGPNSFKPEGGLYARARKIYSDSYSLERAQEEGAQIFNKAPEEIAKFLKEATPAEKEAYRIGTRKAAQDIVNKTPDGADPAKRIFGNTQKRLQLQAAFGDSRHFQNFTRKMQEEIGYAQTKQKVLGGSRTDINLADDGQFIQEAIKASHQGIVKTAAHAVANSIYNKYIGLTKENAAQLARTLTSKDLGLSALDRMIKMQKDPSQLKLVKDVISDNLPQYLGIASDEISTNKKK